MHGEIGVGTAETGNEMVFEGSDGPFCCIATVDARGNKLEVNGFFVEFLLQSVGAFIVKFVELGLQTCLD
jgi:hypothetical protein